MCNTDDNHARQALTQPTRPHQALSQMPRHTTILSRNSTDLDAEYDRFRRGTGPISVGYRALRSVAGASDA